MYDVILVADFNGVFFFILFDTIKSFHTAWFLCFLGFFFFFFFFLWICSIKSVIAKNFIFCNNRVLISTIAIPYVFQSDSLGFTYKCIIQKYETEDNLLSKSVVPGFFCFYQNGTQSTTIVCFWLSYLFAEMTFKKLV